LVVEETDTEVLAEYLRTSGVEVERRLEGVVGAQGEGEAPYVRDPDGYLIELKLYAHPASRDEGLG
jgi:catechol 2,3-dioxygenase-like lactoylglutathione lyase family enzyme